MQTVLLDSLSGGAVLPRGECARGNGSTHLAHPVRFPGQRTRTGNTVGRCSTPRWEVPNSPDPCDEAKG